MRATVTNKLSRSQRMKDALFIFGVSGPAVTHVIGLGERFVRRVAEGKALVEVDHQPDILADRVAQRGDGRQVVAGALAAEPQLQGAKAALGAELDGFFGDRRRRF